MNLCVCELCSSAPARSPTRPNSPHLNKPHNEPNRASRDQPHSLSGPGYHGVANRRCAYLPVMQQDMQGSAGMPPIPGIAPGSSGTWLGPSEAGSGVSPCVGGGVGPPPAKACAPSAAARIIRVCSIIFARGPPQRPASAADDRHYSWLHPLATRITQS